MVRRKGHFGRRPLSGDLFAVDCKASAYTPSQWAVTLLTRKDSDNCCHGNRNYHGDDGRAKDRTHSHDGVDPAGPDARSFMARADVGVTPPIINYKGSFMRRKPNVLVERTSLFLFPNRVGKQLEEKQLRRMFQKHGIAAVPHGSMTSRLAVSPGVTTRVPSSMPTMAPGSGEAMMMAPTTWHRAATHVLRSSTLMSDSSGIITLPSREHAARR